MKRLNDVSFLSFSLLFLCSCLAGCVLTTRSTSRNHTTDVAIGRGGAGAAVNHHHHHCTRLSPCHRCSGPPPLPGPPPAWPHRHHPPRFCQITLHSTAPLPPPVASPLRPKCCCHVLRCPIWRRQSSRPTCATGTAWRSAKVFGRRCAGGSGPADRSAAFIVKRQLWAADCPGHRRWLRNRRAGGLKAACGVRKRCG